MTHAWAFDNATSAHKRLRIYTESLSRRKQFYSEPSDMAKRDDRTTVWPEYLSPDSGPNLASSKLSSGRYHLPALDIDFAAQLLPSSTAGHFHLYLDGMQPLTWRQYKRLLRALARAGVIERGYYKHAVKRRMTLLRLPWITKTAAEHVEGYGPLDTLEWNDPF